MVSVLTVLLVGEREMMARVGKWVREALPAVRLTSAAGPAELGAGLRKKAIDLALVQYPPAWGGGESATARIRERWPGCAVLWLVPADTAPEAGAVLEAGLDGLLVDAPGLRLELGVRLQLALAQAALRGSEARYRSLFDHVPIGLYRTSPRGDIVDANAELVRMLRFPDRETLLRRKASELYARPGERWQILDHHRDRSVLHADEIEMRRADGEPLWVEDVARPLHDASGSVIAYEGSLLDVTERRRLELEKRASEERFRALVQNASDVIAVVNRQAEFQYVTPSAKAQLGYEPDELVGKSGFDLVHPEDLATVAEAFGEVLQHTNPGTPTEYRFRHASGKWVVVESVASNMLDQPGVGGIVLTSRVVTDRKRAEADLRESQRRLSTLLGNLPGMAYRCRNDREWTMEVVSEGCLGLTGHAAADLVGNRVMSFASLIHPDDREKVWQDVQVCVRSGRRYQLTYRLVTASGDARWVWEQGGAVGVAPDGIEILEGFIADISDRKAAEEDLRASRAWLQHIVESIDDVLVVYDREGRYLDVICGDDSLLMRPAAEMLGRTVKEILPGEIAQRFLKGIQIVLEQGTPYDFEYPLELPGGTRWFRARGRRVRSSEGGRPLSLWSISDLTERKVTEEALVRQSRQLELLSRTSQQLNTVLEIPAVLRALVASGMDLVNAAAGTAGLWTGEEMRFTEYNSDGLLQPFEAAMTAGEGVPGIVAETRRSYLANDLSTVPKLGRAQGAHGIRNLINVPILSREGTLLGCLEVHNKRRGESFDEADVSMLEGLASSAAVALENAHLLDERTRAEADLRKLKEFNEDIIQSMGEGIVVQDRLGRFTFANPTAADMLGYRPEELVGEPWTKVVPLDQHAIVREVDAQREAGGASRYELEFVRKDGKRLPALVSGNPRFEDGRFVGMLAVFADISDRKRAEEALRDTTDRLQALVHAAPVGVTVVDLEGRVRLWNPSAEAMFRVPEEEVLDKPLISLRELQVENVDTFTTVIQRILDGEAVSGIEVRACRKDAVPLDVMVSAAPLRDSAGQIYAVMGILADVTDRKRAETALERHAREMSVLYQASLEVAEAGDPMRIVQAVLTRAAGLLGAPMGGVYLVDETGRELKLAAGYNLPPGYEGRRLRLGEGLSGKVVQSGEALVVNDYRTWEGRAMLYDGADFRRMAGVPLRHGRKVIGVITVMDDQRTDTFEADEVRVLQLFADQAAVALENARLLETLEERVGIRTRELAEANKRLQELDRLKSDFVSNVSHELRTPITNVLLYLDLLEQPGREDRHGAYMQVLRRESERLGHLIEDLLMLSRMDQAALKLDRELRVLDPLLAEVLSAHRARAQAKGIDLALEPNPEVPPVWIGYQQMIQVFNNLVGNAVAYTPKDGHVTLTSLVRELPEGAQQVGARVWNDGPRIPAEDTPNLFQRFYRGKTGRESGEAGTGLGLAICKEIVDRHGGRIDVVSTPEDGTSFTVWLPVGGPSA
jgi:PAS domain S-box-containing protein